MIPVLASDFTFVCGSIIFLFGELVSNLDLENAISTWTSEFSLKKWPKFAIFERKKNGKH
jgi:hypothetical protein